MDWRKSTYSSANGGDCLEAAGDHGGVLVRDSTDRDGGKLAFSVSVWQEFIESQR